MLVIYLTTKRIIVKIIQMQKNRGAQECALKSISKGGETMSLEAIREIQSVEEKMETSRAQARAQAQKIISDAEREGRALLEQGRAEAAKKAAAVMTAAEERAAKRREEILAAAEEDCKILSAGADAFMAQAVKMIVERVVES